MGSRGRAPGQGVRGQSPPEAESILSFTSANGVQICQLLLLPCKLLKYAFWAIVCENGSSYAIAIVVSVVCLSVLSVTLVYCGQTVGWINMPLGMEVGLRPVHIVLDGDLAPQRGTIVPNFRPMSIVAKRLDGSRCRLGRR